MLGGLLAEPLTRRTCPIKIETFERKRERVREMKLERIRFLRLMVNAFDRKTCFVQPETCAASRAEQIQRFWVLRRQAQQIIAGERETATLYVGLSFHLKIACGGFAPPELGRWAASLKIYVPEI